MSPTSISLSAVVSPVCPGPLDRSGLPWLRACIQRAQGALGGILVLSVMVQVLALVSPLAYQVVIDRVLPHAALSTLWVILVGLVVVAGMEHGLGTWRGQRQRELARRLDAQVREGLIWRSCCLAPDLTRRFGPEDHQARFRDLDTLRQAVAGPWVSAPADALAAVLLWLVLLGFAPRLATATALACLAQVGLVWWMDHVGAEGKGLVQERLAVADSLAALETLHSHQALSKLMCRHGLDLAAARAERFTELTRHAVCAEGQALIQRLQGVVILGLGAHAVIQTELSLGGLVASNLLIARINATWQRLMSLATGWQEWVQAWRRLARWAELPLDPLLAPAARASGCDPQGETGAPPVARPQVTSWQVQGLVCRMGTDPGSLLRCPEARVEAGEWVVLSGPSGSGKSTLARVLAGLEAPLAGQVQLRTAGPMPSPPSVRASAVWVGPDLRLWQAGLDANLSLFDALALNADARAALEAALGIDRLRMQMGAHSELGLARGAWVLSAGERARIQLYRAWASAAPLIVIDGLDLALNGSDTVQLWQRLQALRLPDRLAPAVIVTTAHPECVPGISQHWTVAAGQVRVRPVRRQEIGATR